MKSFHVYILASKSGVIYVGVTNDLERRVVEHKQKKVAGFTAKYNVNRLVWYESFTNVNDALEAEKRIKGWRREKKVALIVENNPAWRDLSLDFESVSTPRSLAALGMTGGGRGREGARTT